VHANADSLFHVSKESWDNALAREFCEHLPPEVCLCEDSQRKMSFDGDFYLTWMAAGVSHFQAQQHQAGKHGNKSKNRNKHLSKHEQKQQSIIWKHFHIAAFVADPRSLRG
jgi:hypothetical protein